MRSEINNSTDEQMMRLKAKRTTPRPGRSYSIWQNRARPEQKSNTSSRSTGHNKNDAKYRNSTDVVRTRGRGGGKKGCEPYFCYHTDENANEHAGNAKYTTCMIMKKYQ
jgi:hypothetical protein